MRIGARESGFEGVDTHAGILRALMELEARRRGRRDISWVADGLRVSSRGKVLFFTGCLPYYSVVFRELGVDMLRP